MSKWRPEEGWFEKKNEWMAVPIPRPFPMREAYEAGASALLEALKERGHYFSTDYPLNFGQFPLVPAGWSGWLTTIPDEDWKQIAVKALQAMEEEKG